MPLRGRLRRPRAVAAVQGLIQTQSAHERLIRKVPRGHAAGARRIPSRGSPPQTDGGSVHTHPDGPGGSGEWACLLHASRSRTDPRAARDRLGIRLAHAPSGTRISQHAAFDDLRGRPCYVRVRRRVARPRAGPPRASCRYGRREQQIRHRDRG